MIGIGIAGSGVGLRTHAPGFLQTNGARLQALFSPNLEKARRLAVDAGIAQVYPSFDELVADDQVDLLVVASPNAFHLEQISKALLAGKHVLAEKPLAISSTDAETLVEIARDRPSQLTIVNHQLRFSPYFAALRRILSEGALGPVVQARITQQGMNASDLSAPFSWSFDAAAGGGVRWAMGSHLVDLACFLFGWNVTSVLGSMHAMVHERRDDERFRSVTASAEFAGAMLLDGGEFIFLSANAAGHGGFRFDIDVYCERGEAHFNLDDKLSILSERGGRVQHLREIPGLKQGELDNSVSFFAGTFRYYADEIIENLSAGGGEPVRNASTFGEAATVVNILEAFKESYRRSASIELNSAVGARDAT